MVKFPCFLWKTWPLLLLFFIVFPFSIYIFPLCLIFPCLFLMAARVASTKRVWRICYTWPLHTTTAGSSDCQQHSPVKKCQLDQQNPESSTKTTASQIGAVLWHAFLRSAFASRPCNCGLYDWLMQTWQVQNTALKPKYWLLMLLGIHLEYKTARCTLKMAGIGMRRSRSSWHMVNTAFSVRFLRNMLCLSGSLDNHWGHNNCFNCYSELWHYLPCLFRFCDPVPH